MKKILISVFVLFFATACFAQTINPPSNYPPIHNPSGNEILGVEAGPYTSGADKRGIVSMTLDNLGVWLDYQPSLGVVTPQQFSGTTADVKIAACLAAIPSGGTCDARGFGATRQTIAATVTVGSGQTLIFDPATRFQAGTSSLDLFVFEPKSIVRGFTFDCANQPNYSGILFRNDTAQAYLLADDTSVSDITVDSTCQNDTTGTALQLYSVSASYPIYFTSFNHWRVNGLANALHLMTNNGGSPGGMVNGNHFIDWLAVNTVYPLRITTNAGMVSGNMFSPFSGEQNSNGVNGILVDFDSSGFTVTGNSFYGSWWDYSVGINYSMSAKGNFAEGCISGSTNDSLSANSLINMCAGDTGWIVFNGGNAINTSSPVFGVFTGVQLSVSTVDGAAFITKVSGNGTIPLSSYVGHQITISDGTNTASGYIASAGTGETYGSGILTNSNMETGNPPTGWNSSASATLTQAADERTGGTGSYSLQVARGTSNTSANQAVTVTVGALYKGDAWIKNINQNTGGGIGLNSLGQFKGTSYYAGATWHEQTGYLTARQASDYAVVYSAATQTDSIRIDDYTITQVLTPDSTGAVIVSTSGGSTQNWASNSGLNPNAASFTVTLN